jgi:O-antigen ligase
MNEIMPYVINFGVPALVVSIAVIFIVIGMGLTAAGPRYIVIPLLLIMLVVPQATNYGRESGEIAALSIFWVKGSKSFFFPFYDMVLLSVWFFGVFIAKNWAKYPEQYSNPLSKWYIAFSMMFLGHVIAAIFGKKPLLYEFGGIGIINVLKQGMFVSLLVATIRSERDIKNLLRFVLVCLSVNEFWGLFRYFFLGGDSTNIYADAYSETGGAKITFFDINEHILSCVMIGICSWKLLLEKLGWQERLCYFIMGMMALLVPLLSARRTAQLGIILAMILLFVLLPKGKRFPILIVLAISLPIGLASLATRSNDPTKSIAQKILIDIKTDNEIKDPRKSRFYELETAWKTIKKNPLFGVGPSGEFEVDSPIGLEYHDGNYGFVHSGFGHILLKTGFTGLFCFLGLYVTFLINILKGYKFVLQEHKALVVGSLCGFVALIPTLISGAPIPEIRTMLVAGFLFSIPLICISIGEKKISKDKIDH